MAPYDTFANDHPITLLSHRLHYDLGCTHWRLCTAEVPRPVESGVGVLADNGAVCALLTHGEVAAQATAQMPQGKGAAAKRALKTIEEMDMAHFKAHARCDCTTI